MIFKIFSPIRRHLTKALDYGSSIEKKYRLYFKCFLLLIVYRLRKWQTRWAEDDKAYSNTKHWFPEVRHNKTDQILALTRYQLGLLTQFITGFCNMNHHTNKKDKAISPI